MSKGLEALKRMYFRLLELDPFITSDNYDIIEKELKALEIIKKKLIDLARLHDAIKRNDLSFYNCYCYERLTQEEFDLLKEVLK